MYYSWITVKFSCLHLAITDLLNISIIMYKIVITLIGLHNVNY